MVRFTLTVCVIAVLAGCGGPYGWGWGNAKEIHKAAYYGDQRRLERALAKGDDPNAVATFSMFLWVVGDDTVARLTPLDLAAKKGHCETIHALLDAGASKPDILHDVVYYCPQCLSGLLARGIPPDSRGTPTSLLGGTALHVAAYYNKVGAAEQLLDAGADIEARAGTDTPLHCAARQDAAEVVALLLGRGADPFAVESNGWTPRRVAENVGSARAAAMLEAAEAKARNQAAPVLSPDR